MNDVRLIDADHLRRWILSRVFKTQLSVADVIDQIDREDTIEPERKKDTIQKFHDYQVEWLLSHCDLELEPQLEEWVVRFLHDTANCYMMEIDRKEGDRE